MKRNHYTMMARNAIRAALEGVSDGSPVGFGCSGGADSLALLAGLSTLYRGDRSKLVHVVIVNHQLQDVTNQISAETAALVEKFGFTAHVVPVQVVTSRDGMESAAREARYQAFESIIEKFDLKAFLIGHTKTDQAEQVFLGILRGSGTRSLAGIREERGIYKRPFLNTLSRQDTQKVCEENNLDYWCDPQNDSLEYKRVSVRKMLQTTEEATGQNIVDNLVRTAQISSEDAEALDFFTDIAYANLEENFWNIVELERLPKAIRNRAYRRKLVESGAASDTISFELTNRVDVFVTDWRGQKAVHFSNNVTVERSNNRLLFKTS